MKALFTTLALGFLLTTVFAAEVSVTGNWNEVVDASDLTSGAGSNLSRQFTSAPGATTLDISNTSGGTWRVYARRADNRWSPGLRLSVRRSSTGSGSGSIAGGESFIEVTNTDTEIFSGTGDRTAIALQTKLTGMSVDVSPDAYSASIVFVVVP